MVFFALKDKSPAEVERLIAGCQRFLSDHTGTHYFSVGRLSDAARPVNVRDFDVALHLIFDSRQAHDDYQVHPRHVEFVETFRDNWSNVRVFDSDIV
jgi:hypothetical protein